MSKAKKESYRDNIIKLANERYGEERVSYDDLMGELIIHYPKIIVQSDSGVTHENLDLYVAIDLEDAYFKIAKATYTINEYREEYTHSHCPRDNRGQYKEPCLGSGPIRSTIAALLANIKDYDTWLIYFMEIEQFLATESEQGGPYIRIRSLGNSSGNTYYTFSKNELEPVVYKLAWETAKRLMLSDYLKYIKTPIVESEQVCRGTTSIFRISKVFIEVANEYIKSLPTEKAVYIKNKLIHGKYLVEVVEKDDDISVLVQSISSFNGVESNTSIVFKDKYVPLTIIKDNNEEERGTFIVNISLLNTIENIINQEIKNYKRKGYIKRLLCI